MITKDVTRPTRHRCSQRIPFNLTVDVCSGSSSLDDSSIAWAARCEGKKPNQKAYKIFYTTSPSSRLDATVQSYISFVISMKNYSYKSTITMLPNSQIMAFEKNPTTFDINERFWKPWLIHELIRKRNDVAALTESFNVANRID